MATSQDCKGPELIKGPTLESNEIWMYFGFYWIPYILFFCLLSFYVSLSIFRYIYCKNKICQFSLYFLLISQNSPGSRYWILHLARFVNSLNTYFAMLSSLDINLVSSEWKFVSIDRCSYLDECLRRICASEEYTRLSRVCHHDTLNYFVMPPWHTQLLCYATMTHSTSLLCLITPL